MVGPSPARALSPAEHFQSAASDRIAGASPVGLDEQAAHLDRPELSGAAILPGGRSHSRTRQGQQDSHTDSNESATTSSVDKPFTPRSQNPDAESAVHCIQHVRKRKAAASHEPSQRAFFHSMINLMGHRAFRSARLRDPVGGIGLNALHGESGVRLCRREPRDHDAIATCSMSLRKFGGNPPLVAASSMVGLRSSGTPESDARSCARMTAWRSSSTTRTSMLFPIFFGATSLCQNDQPLARPSTR